MDLGTETIIIVRAALADRHGDPTGTPTQTASHGWNIQPGSSSEDDAQRTTVTSTWRAFGPGEAGLRATDTVIWRDVTYEVVGDPDVWPVDGELHHTQAELRRVRG